VRRGEIWWATLAPRSGSEQQGTRPVLVVSHDGFNQVPTWMSVIVVPISSSPSQGRRGPTAVPLPAGAGGLKTAGAALCHQVTTLDRRKLTSRLGVLPAPLLAQVGEGLAIAQGL
jgi:mRNA interferase MazF